MIAKISKAVIPAAGLGTRMLPATKILPKEMLPVAGMPIIQYSVEEAARSGIETVILVVNEKKSIIRKHFQREPALERFLESSGQIAEAETIRRLPDLVNLLYVEQPKPLGLGHAIWCARHLLAGEPFAVLLPDVIFESERPVLQQMQDAYQRRPGTIIAIREVEPEEVSHGGIVRVEGLADGRSSSIFRLSGVVEKPSIENAPSRFSVAGRYLLEPAILEELKRTSPDAHGEIQLSGALNRLCLGSYRVHGLCIEGTHHNVGEPFGFLRANLEISMSNPQLRPAIQAYLRRLQVEGLPPRNHFKEPS
jgi:UTP--glucose-1-phosphate uridylyltransferase